MLTKLPVYGIHLGPIDLDAATEPWAYHRGWPGVGPTHSLLFGVLVGLLVLWTTRNRGWALGLMIGQWAHALTDTGDSVGTMLFFPFTTQHYTVGRGPMPPRPASSATRMPTTPVSAGCGTRSGSSSSCSGGGRCRGSSSSRGSCPTTPCGAGCDGDCGSPTGPCWRCTGPTSATASPGWWPGPASPASSPTPDPDRLELGRTQLRGEGPVELARVGRLPAQHGARRRSVRPRRLRDLVVRRAPPLGSGPEDPVPAPAPT